MFEIEDHGTIVLVRPLTRDVTEWLHASVDAEAQWFGRALVVEPRYLEALLEGLVEEGFALQ